MLCFEFTCRKSAAAGANAPSNPSHEQVMLTASPSGQLTHQHGPYGTFLFGPLPRFDIALGALLGGAPLAGPTT